LCPRCGAELESVLACIRLATLLQNECRALLAKGKNAEALKAARRAFFLCNDEDTRKTLVAALVANRFISAAMSVFVL
jgi:hypothetical protein